MKVKLVDLQYQISATSAAVSAAVMDVLASGRYIMGPEIEMFEEAIAEYCGARHAVACSSGSDALLMALMAIGVGPGDEVITTPYTFFATAGAIARLQARPVFVDIDPDTFNVCPQAIAGAITPRTRCIIPVHLFGQPADLDPIVEVARHHDLFIIEDAAQSIGARYREQRVGSLGDIGCFSFFPSKNLGCCGDGGICTTNDSGLAESLRVLRQHGAARKYYHTRIGGNFRLDTIQAAVLLAKLPFLDSWNEERRLAAHRYREMILEAELLRDTVALPVEGPDVLHVYNQFVVKVPDRDALRRHLSAKGIGNAVYYPLPLHLQQCFAYLGYQPGDLPNAEQACHSTLAIPIYPGITPGQQQYVVDAMSSFYAEHKGRSEVIFH